MKIQLRDAIQNGLDLAIVAQPLLDHGFEFGADAELLIASAGVTDSEDPYEMAWAVSADLTGSGMADAAAEKRSAEDLGSGRKRDGKFGAGSGDAFVFHLLL